MSRTSDGAVQESLFPADGLRIRKVSSPKRKPADRSVLADLFPYYAGFSYKFACELLQDTCSGESDLVLDPWNGSGTTTLAAQAIGLKSVGVDLNPIANLVAQFRAQTGPAAVHQPPVRHRRKINSNDPLLDWLHPTTTGRIRDWTETLRERKDGSAILAFLALFRVVRTITKRFEGSNPTWVRRARNDEEIVKLAARQLDELIVIEQQTLLDRLRGEAPTRAPALIATGSSTKLPLGDASIDVILTSPPYLTRIDYAVSYARELAVLGINIASDRTLRSALMGTTLIRKADPYRERPYGTNAASLVASVSQHHSKASSGYYLKQTIQYLDDLIASLKEISRVTRAGGALTMVVQDSYYKDIHVNLAEICAEEAERMDWQLTDWTQFEVGRSWTTVNTAARAYPKGKVAETVMTLRRGKDE
ncbi:DNA methyltransferase [Dactylosporangium sp. AC04546]|uniref:DNA methyltransferase n=1 Tax=Dactylosporangium sp. AC04546 TaxID=2862460 RepID=UPI001EE02B8F|nr:DNA methyltransferase [Dactylosporangium sp. AC04546]WVK82303.1 DNA methyltransferase [Dactylosporangium sp. AC04546]